MIHRPQRPAIVLLLLLVSCATINGDEPKTQTQSPSRGKKPTPIFDGKTLNGWHVLSKLDFEDHGKVTVADGEILLGKGKPATGIRYQGDFPRLDYEVSLEAKRVDGRDFFCGMTFPVGQQYCTLILGGWGGGVTGLSNIDDEAAVENETTGYVDFKTDQWYHVRLRVTQQEVEAWIDGKKIVDLDSKDRKFSIWWEQEPVRPFGIANWYTGSALKNILLTRTITEPEER